MRSAEYDERERVAALADPATNTAFDRITSDGLDEAPELLRLWTMAQLLSEPDDFAWFVRGLLAALTYGQLAGPMKTLKSYLLAFIQAGVASGVPILGQFEPVGSPRGVLAYIGEGGRGPWMRRFKRVCASMGINPSDLDLLHAVFDVAPIPSLVFQESLRRHLDKLEICPLVTLDPLYSYHGTTTKASDLHQEGALLNILSGPCIEAEATLLVVNHYNQTGSGSSLKRITMAGSGEWADSWLLLDHREPPDVEHGLFRLTLEIGSRQWGGMTWNLDLDIGRFDIETGSHDGQIAWDLNRATFDSVKPDKSAGTDRASKRIADTIADHPFEMTKTEIRTAVGGNRDTFDRAFDALADAETIVHHQRGRAEAGTTKKRLLWGMGSDSANAAGPGWDAA
jgi:hypothetical protein